MQPDDAQSTAGAVVGPTTITEPLDPGPLSSQQGFAHGLSRDHWQQRDRRNRLRFGLSLVLAIAWLVFSLWLSLPWLSDLANLSHPVIALFVLTFVAYVPGFMNAFLLTSLVLRPDALRQTPATWPAISVLVAAYQEEALIARTLWSLSALSYAGDIEIIVIDDGSTIAPRRSWENAGHGSQSPRERRFR
jgi:hypothetical protein